MILHFNKGRVSRLPERNKKDHLKMKVIKMNLVLPLKLRKNEESCKKKNHEGKETDLELWIMCFSSLNLICWWPAAFCIADICPQSTCLLSSDRYPGASAWRIFFFFLNFLPWGPLDLSIMWAPILQELQVHDYKFSKYIYCFSPETNQARWFHVIFAPEENFP